MGDEFEIDEWDGRGSFAQHAVAGSIAGLAEHSLMFPVDTVKTLMQVRQGPQLQASLAAAEGAGAGGGLHGMVASASHLISSGGMPRMWRGVQTMFSGCVPAHAAYFSVYEGCKARLQAPRGVYVNSPASTRPRRLARVISPAGEFEFARDRIRLCSAALLQRFQIIVRYWDSEASGQPDERHNRSVRS